MPGGAKPKIVPCNSGWQPGLAFRKRGVPEERWHSGWQPGFAHGESGVSVQLGLVDVAPDSHRLRGARCSNWAPGTLYVSKSNLQSLNMSTLGIALLLPSDYGIGQLAGASGETRSDDLRDTCLQQLGSVISALIMCPGDGDTAGNLTLVGVVDAPLP